MENYRFWSFTLGILIVWQLVWLNNAAHIGDTEINMPLNKNAEEQKLNCNTLCAQCDCKGFYCGEECICECNNNENGAQGVQQPDTECLAVMQNNARALNLPFELLIQGSNNNRIVRTALNLQSEYSFNNTNGARPKRATVVIYKPDMEEKSTTTEISSNRNRRGVSKDNLDWLTDFANGLVRPAPLNGNRLKSSSQVTRKTQPQSLKTKNNKSSYMTEKPEGVWFDDDDEKEEEMRERKSSSKPTVSYKKQRSSTTKKTDFKTPKDGKIKKNEVPRSHRLVESHVNYDNLPENKLKDSSKESLAELLYHTPMKMVEKLPAAVRDAIKRLHENAELSNANKKRETELIDLEDGKEDNDHYDDEEDVNSADSESAQDHEEHDEEYVDDAQPDNFEELIRNLRKHLLKAMDKPTGKTSLKGRHGMSGNRITNSPYHIPQRSPDFMKSIRDAMET